MMRGLADSLLPKARKQIKEAYDKKDFEKFFKRNSDNQIKIVEVYENYTAAFGMIVNQSGFQSAFAMYNEDGGNSEGDKKLVTQLLYDILCASTELIQEKKYDDCRDKIIDGEHNTDDYEALFKEASIALKRAIRTFEIVKK